MIVKIDVCVMMCVVGFWVVELSSGCVCVLCSDVL